MDRILTAAERLHDLADAAEGSMTDAEKENFAASKEYVEKFEAAMEDDANTADAVSAVFELVKFINVNSSEQNSKEYLQALYQRLETLCDVLGIIIEKKEEILDSDIEALIAERQAARKRKELCPCRRDQRYVVRTGDYFRGYQRRSKMEKGIDAYIKEQFHLPPVDIRTYSPLTLATSEMGFMI